MFRNDLPNQVLRSIAGCLAPQEEDGEAACFWDREADGRFTVSSAYELLQDSDVSENNQLWRRIWEWEGAQRVRVFLWLAARQNLLTNVERQRRHMTTSAMCMRCGEADEDTDHVLRYCKLAKAVWCQLLTPIQLHQFLQGDLHGWLLRNLGNNPPGLPGDGRWARIFGLTCWKLWDARNKALFQNQHLQPSTTAQVVRHLAEFTAEAAARIGKARGERVKQNLPIVWLKPPPMMVSLNCDGARKSNGEGAGAGSLIRDGDGRWLVGCCRHIGHCSSLQAELWGLLDGLELAWANGFRAVSIQLDCLVALTLVRTREEGSNGNMSLVRRIKQLALKEWQLTWTHVYREGNRCADFLASFALGLDLGNHILPAPPDGLMPLLQEDAEGIGIVRRCLSVN